MSVRAVLALSFVISTAMFLFGVVLGLWLANPKRERELYEQSRAASRAEDWRAR